LGVYSRPIVPRPANIDDFDFVTVPASVPVPSHRPKTKGVVGRKQKAESRKQKGERMAQGAVGRRRAELQLARKKVRSVNRRNFTKLSEID